MKAAKLRQYWRAVHRVARRTGQSVSNVRHIYKGKSDRLRDVSVLKNPAAAYRRDVRTYATDRAVERHPGLTRADVRQAYAMLVDYSPGSLERIAVAPGGKRPADVPVAVWKKMSYVPRSGVAQGWRVIYRHKLTGEYMGQRSMRSWYASAYAMRYLANMPELFSRNDRLRLSDLPAVLREGITKTAMRRGYFTDKEAVKWMVKLLHQVTKEGRFDVYDMLVTIWPEIEGVYEKGS